MGARDLTISQLEEFVSFMVKSGKRNGQNAVTKPRWWPRELAFRYPVERVRAKAVDAPIWREMLHRLVARCYAFHNTCRGSRHNMRRSTNGYAVRVKDKSLRKADRRNCAAATVSTRSSSGDSTSSWPDDVGRTIKSANSAVHAYAPVVSLGDVENIGEPQQQNLNKDGFLNYFGLGVATNNETDICSTTSSGKMNFNHPRNLINSPHVPFSSDVGIKLIKEWHEIPHEIHERKLERIERYLQHYNPSTNSSSNIQYEVTYNKNSDSDCSHFYIFPNKNFHRKNKLTPHAQHLLNKYCKPCTVTLMKLDESMLAKNKASNRFRLTNRNPKVRHHLKSNFQSSKENIQQKNNSGSIAESRVALTADLHKLKENAPYQTLPVKDSNENFGAANKSLQQSFAESSIRTRHQNFALKTLSPRNENSVGTTIDIKKPVQSSSAECENLINASVILQPFNAFFGLRPTGKATSSKTEKKRDNIYYPRRFSPRLQTVNTNKPMTIL